MDYSFRQGMAVILILFSLPVELEATSNPYWEELAWLKGRAQEVEVNIPSEHAPNWPSNWHRARLQPFSDSVSTSQSAPVRKNRKQLKRQVREWASEELLREMELDSTKGDIARLRFRSR